MTDVSRSVSISKKFSSVNDSSTKHIYDGVFSSAQPSRPKFNGFALPSRIEDYAEIFACSLSSASAFASQGSSIPILDLPAVDRSRDGISSVDYSGVFGDGEVGSIGLSYEEFLRESKKRAGRDFPLPRVPPQTSAPHSRSQEFLVNSGGHRSSTVRWKQSSRSQEFPLKLWKNQTPTNNGHNLTSNVPGTVPSKSPESPPNMINSQTPISTENGHTSTSSGIRSSNSQESQLSAVNSQMTTGTDNDQTSTSPAAWSLKSQEVPRSTVINPMPTSTDNVQASTSPAVQPFKSQEFPRSTGDNQMPTSTDISSVPSESQEFPLNAENYSKETSATSSHSFDDTAKHFNVSYHKINHSNTDDMTHVAELNAVSGYTCLFNEPPSKKTSFETLSSSDADMTMDDDKKKKQGKHTRATSDLSTHYPTCERASGLRRGFSGPLSSAQDSHSFGSSGSFKRLASQKSKGASNKLRAGFEGDFMPPLLVKELDVNSEAAISAAAVKRAIEEAEVQIRLAKELLKGNDDKASVKVSFKDTLRVRDTCLKDSSEAYELWRKKKVKSRSENRHVEKVNGSPRSSVEHKVPKDRKVGNAADRLTEKMQEDNVRSDDTIEKAVSSESSISPATAEEVSWYTEQREPVDQAEDMEVADGKLPNPAQESTRLDSAGGEWDAAKHLSQLFSGVKNRLVSFMSKQPETGRKVQQMDFPSASRNLDQSIESTSYIMKDVDAFKAKSDIEQLSEMEVQVTPPVPTSQKAMEREGNLHQEGAGIKMQEVEASKLKCAFVMEQQKVTEGVKQSPDCKKLNDEPRDHFEPELEVKNFVVLGLGVDEQQEKFNCPDAAMPNELPELESEVETSPVGGHQMNEDDPEHQNVASKVRDIDIQGEAQDSSLHKYVDSATLEHEKGQMDTVRPEEHDKRPETAGSLGGLDDGEVTSWDSSDESVQEIEANEVSEERADDSFHCVDGRSGLEAAVDIKERKLENREIDVEDYKACRVEDGKYDEQCREEGEIAAVSDEACKQGEREISAVNDEEHKADERENVSDLQHKGGVEILEENAPSGLLTRDDEDACLGEENEKSEAEESPSEDVASPSKVFHDSSNYNEHLAALEGVSKLANFSFFSRMKKASDRVDQSREEACDSEVSCGEPEAMIELYTSNVEAAGGADQISSAQVVGEFIEPEMRTASVLPEGSIYMVKTDQEIKDDSAAHPVNFQESSCEIEQNSEQKVDNGKAKRLSTDDSFENLGCEVEEESECSTYVVAADVDDHQCDEPMCKEEGKYNVVEDEPVADIGVTEAGVDNNDDDVPMGEEEWKNEVVGVLETGTGVSGDDVDKNQHDVGVGKEEGKHNLEASPHKRRRWFQNREQAESSKQPSILVEEEMLAEIDQEQKHAEESRWHDSVEAHVDDSGDKTGESGAVLVEKGKNNTVEVTHRRRRWFDNSQETGIPQKPILFDGNGTSKEPAPVIADESKTKERIQSDVSNADSERKEVMREGDVLSAEGETKADMKAAHRRKRWFEHEEKIGLGQRATIPEVDNEATVEMKDETETRENAANSKQSSETSTSPDISGKVDPEDIRPQRDLKETSNRNREREKERIAVERVIREARERAFVDARERAERAAAEKANTGARPKSAVHGRHGGSTSAEAVNKSIYEKASAEAKLRAERAAVERATAEARERALQKAMSEKAANKDLKYQNSSPPASSRSSASEKSNGTINESPQRRKARLERNKRTMERAAKALEEKNMRDVVAQREQAERNKFADALDLEVKRWSNGKEGNLRALLSTLQYVLGSESGWQPTSLTELVSTTAVRKAYKRAALCVHPDKLQQRGATIQQKYICEKVFDLLKEAWHKFNPDDR